MTRLIAAIVLCLPLAAGAQNVYRTVDENGNVIFTDTPPAGGIQTEQVEIREPNTSPAVEIPAPAPEPEAATEEAAGYQVSITSPADETSFPMGPGNFSVSAAVKPALSDSESLQLFLDGAPWGEAQRDTEWALTNVFRGAHDLTVAVISTDGEQLAVSPPVRVFVHRPSVNFRNRN